MKPIYIAAVILLLSYWIPVGLHIYAVPDKPFGSMPVIWPFTLVRQ